MDRGDTVVGDRLVGWVQSTLPRMNADVLNGRLDVSDLVQTVNEALRDLGSPVVCSTEECRRRLIVLGMLGSSVERHSQEAGSPPGVAIDQLAIRGWPFRKYFATLASRTGGPPRDSFLSFVVWNAPPVHVYLPETPHPFLTLPSAFPDDQPGPLTFSDDPGERLFILLLKRCAALEMAVNDHLWPVCEGLVDVTDHQALRHIEAATMFLKAVRAEMRRFMQRPEFTAPFFLDVLRQYACKWDPQESYDAPSGAHDWAFIARDILLGTEPDGYDAHVDLLYNVLDTRGQADVARARSLPTLPSLLAAAVRLSVDELFGLSPEDGGDIALRHPWLTTYFRLYQANAEVAATHWSMVYKYLSGPMRERDWDAIVVSNYAGTTHMVVEELRRYTAARTNHPLRCLKEVLRVPRVEADSDSYVDVAGGDG